MGRHGTLPPRPAIQPLNKASWLHSTGDADARPGGGRREKDLALLKRGNSDALRFQKRFFGDPQTIKLQGMIGISLILDPFELHRRKEPFGKSQHLPIVADLFQIDTNLAALGH
jgi:hypothetical protein